MAQVAVCPPPVKNPVLVCPKAVPAVWAGQWTYIADQTGSLTSADGSVTDCRRRDGGVQCGRLRTAGCTEG